MDFPIANKIEEELQAQNLVWNQTLQYINSMTLKSAVELGIPDVLHRNGGRVSLSNLAVELSVPPNKTDYLRRLMRFLIHAGCFTSETNTDDEEVSYLLTPLSRLLVTDKVTGASPWVRLQLDPEILSTWQSLGAWFQGDERTPFSKTHGKEIFEIVSQSEKLNDLFNAGMACDSRIVTKSFVEKHRDAFAGLKSIVDLGGGTGGLGLTVAEAFPWMKVIVFDLPHVVATAPKGTLVDFKGGNMFEHIPPSDAIILKLICHDWDDEDCVKILKQCKKAIPPKEEGGKVMILDMVVNSKTEDHKATETQLFFDMLMMVNAGGKEREEHEWEKIFIEAGFSSYKAKHGSGMVSLIEVYP
ncbi:Trans-resveratrol di-O-methyltransferase [Acorus gramineus]|uniref:Trans-resveratrol di-O-methyltransferase n=1 Tax=Acorus gramineus TaxID=55184 RepID=A0AAV9AV11_ACOGR|nr:Trans-resveratrol di-O-methyltransferase [Acorus gramineus]